MSDSKNYHLPDYPHRPGRTPHPLKDGGHGNVDIGVCEDVTWRNLSGHPYHIYSLILFDNKFYWEAHVYWEEMWIKTGRKGELADYLKGLIKISAGFLKFELGQEDIAREHLERAIELFSPLKEFENYLDFRIDLLENEITTENISYHNIKQLVLGKSI